MRVASLFSVFTLVLLSTSMVFAQELVTLPSTLPTTIPSTATPSASVDNAPSTVPANAPENAPGNIPGNAPGNYPGNFPGNGPAGGPGFNGPETGGPGFNGPGMNGPGFNGPGFNPHEFDPFGGEYRHAEYGASYDKGIYVLGTLFESDKWTSEFGYGPEEYFEQSERQKQNGFSSMGDVCRGGADSISKAATGVVGDLEEFGLIGGEAAKEICNADEVEEDPCKEPREFCSERKFYIEDTEVSCDNVDAAITQFCEEKISGGLEEMKAGVGEEYDRMKEGCDSEKTRRQEEESRRKQDEERRRQDDERWRAQNNQYGNQPPQGGKYCPQRPFTEEDQRKVEECKKSGGIPKNDDCGFPAHCEMGYSGGSQANCPDPKVEDARKTGECQGRWHSEPQMAGCSTVRIVCDPVTAGTSPANCPPYPSDPKAHCEALNPGMDCAWDGGQKDSQGCSIVTCKCQPKVSTTETSSGSTTTQACSLPNAASSSSGGACVINSCNTGFANCNGNNADGCEVALGTKENCASCGNACPAGSECRSNACTTVTQSGYSITGYQIAVPAGERPPEGFMPPQGAPSGGYGYPGGNYPPQGGPYGLQGGPGFGGGYDGGFGGGFGGPGPSMCSRITSKSKEEFVKEKLGRFEQQLNRQKASCLSGMKQLKRQCSDMERQCKSGLAQCERYKGEYLKYVDSCMKNIASKARVEELVKDGLRQMCGINNAASKFGSVRALRDAGSAFGQSGDSQLANLKAAEVAEAAEKIDELTEKFKEEDKSAVSVAARTFLGDKGRQADASLLFKKAKELAVAAAELRGFALAKYGEDTPPQVKTAIDLMEGESKEYEALAQDKYDEGKSILDRLFGGGGKLEA